MLSAVHDRINRLQLRDEGIMAFISRSATYLKRRMRPPRTGAAEKGIDREILKNQSIRIR
jgi:hypothetical protein